jgi:hypothetical protein
MLEQIGEMAEKAGQDCYGGTPCAPSIRDQMVVIASGGKRVGTVDRVEFDGIKLTKKDSPDGQHHHIPMNWIESVDAQVHLTKNFEEISRAWQEAPSESGV